MDVILLERVEKLGAIGDVVTVKNGFARNYLLPNKKALRANESNRKLFEAKRAEIETDNANKRTEAEAASKGIEGKTVKLIRQASNTGQLYGSVSARDIVEALDSRRRQGRPRARSCSTVRSRRSGSTRCASRCTPRCRSTVKVNVARSPEEAELQAQGVDIMASMFERDNAGFTEEFDPNAEPGVLAVEAETERGSSGRSGGRSRRSRSCRHRRSGRGRGRSRQGLASRNRRSRIGRRATVRRPFSWPPSARRIAD